MSLTGFAYATNNSANTITKINLSTLAVVGSPLPVGAGPIYLAVDPQGAFAYVVNNTAKTVTKVNLSNFTTVGSALAVADVGQIVCDQSGYAYICGVSTNSVIKINLGSMAVAATLGGFNSPEQMVVDSTGTYAYVANAGNGTVSKVNLSTFAIVGTATLYAGANPSKIALDPSNTYAYTTDYNNALVAKITVSSMVWDGDVALAAGSAASGIAIDPTGSFAYVCDEANSYITKINLSTFSVSATLTSDTARPINIVIDSFGTYAYVCDTLSGSEAVTMIDLATFTRHSSITMNTPQAIAIAPPWSAPSAPTLSAPANASYQDVSSGITLGPATYNSTDGSNQNAYALRIKVSGGSYLYWNASTNALQSTIVWNAITTAPGATWSVALPSGILSNGNVYNWSFASQEAGGNLQGVFASDFTFTASAPPTTTVTAPTGNIASNSPLVTWTDTLSGSTQADYEVIVEYGAYGATPGSGITAWSSGVVASAATSVTIGVTLTNTVTYRAFVQVTNSGGQVSAWGYTTFTVTVDAPATPILTAVATNDPTTGAPMVQLTLQGNDNGLTTVQASLEGGLTTGWTAGANTTIASSATWSQDGSYSLAMTATAAGAVIASTPIGTSGVSVVAGSIVRAMAFFHSATTARACTVALSFYNAAGTLLSTVTSTSVNSTLTGSGTGAQAFVVTTAPVGAVTASLTLNGAALGAGEVLYADSMLIAPAQSTALPYDALVASLNPSAWWKLNDPVGSTTALDSSGNGYNGTVVGGVTFGEPGAIPGNPTDTAALFDGSTGYIETSFIPPITSVAVNTWVNVPAGGLRGNLWQNGTNAGGLALAISENQANPNVLGNQLWFAYPYVVGFDTGVFMTTGLHMITFVLDASSHLTLYVDGILVFTYTTNVPIAPTGNSFIGSANSGANFSNAKIAQITYFPTALTASQVAQLYSAAPIPGWTRGGLVGTTTATINFSDDQVNYYPVRNGVNVSISPLTQKVVVNDYEGALGFTRYYQGQVSA